MTSATIETRDLMPSGGVVAYAVVHTLGSGCTPDHYPEVTRFEVNESLAFDPAYSQALDLSHEIRQHEGHWARVDAIFANGARVIR